MMTGSRQDGTRSRYHEADKNTMNTTRDRLYNLLPMIYRQRDAENGESLRALMQVIEEQADLVEADIARLYENWFIETCQDWVVPYIGDLIGWTPVSEAGLPADDATEEGRRRNRLLISRREVANTLRYRRRKGALGLLDLLANDISGWPARAVEFYAHLAVTQSVKFPRLDRGRTAGIRDGSALDRLSSPFDAFAHSADIRNIGSCRGEGWYNIANVGLFVWRLKSFSVSGVALEEDKPVKPTAAICFEEAGPHCYTFSALGHDCRLFTRPVSRDTIVGEPNEEETPGPILRRAFEDRRSVNGARVSQASALYYGANKSLAVWAPGWNKNTATDPIPASDVLPADLSDWGYRPPKGKIAIDPELGRIAFPPGQLPSKGVQVLYHYGFAAEIGGGEYHRLLPQTPGRTAALYRVGERGDYATIQKALDAWSKDMPAEAVIEIVDSHIYTEQVTIALAEKQNLTIRAADRRRPVLRILDLQADLPDAFLVGGEAGSRFALDGLLVTGRNISVQGDIAEVTVRHCTLVPGWGVDCNCDPKRPGEPSVELVNFTGRLHIEHTILGPVYVRQEENREPISVHISDSILDATSVEREAFRSSECCMAPTHLTILRTTVFGTVHTHSIALAENCLFTGPLYVARRQVGCVRFCYVPASSRTPARYQCQPDMVREAAVGTVQDAGWDLSTSEGQQELADERAREELRVIPLFESVRYGASVYARLTDRCAREIRRGADDESEMGVYHDLFEPQRLANLRARLDEFTPAGSQAAVILVD